MRVKRVFLWFTVLFSGLLLAVSQSVSGNSSATPVSTPSVIQALTPPPRSVPGDLWADVIVGKPDFSEITPNQVTHDRLFRPGGVLVDRSVRPNRIYVYDGGNSRVLGLSHIGVCLAGPNSGQNCTANSDCPSSACKVQNGIGADLVLGQPGLTDYSACNGDGNYQNYPDRKSASAATLCGMPEGQISLLEGGSHANMAVDSAGNLYVPDFDNHRVLRYNGPFTSDAIADYVWGQDDFAGNLCNQGRGINQPDASSLCYRSPYNEGFVGGVDMDSLGNLWITDNQNNRVLRFPRDPVTGIPTHTANLVLGQPNFTSANRGSALNQMSAPAAVRVDISGTVYVADSRNNRVLIFNPPLVSGMPASQTLGSGLRLPTGLEFDPGGGIWVHDSENNQLLLFVDGVVQKVLFKDMPNYTGACGGNYTGDGPLFTYPDGGTADPSNVCDARGSIGIDVDGNVFIAANAFVHDVWRFPAPIPSPGPGTAHSADATLFTPYQFALQNYVGLKGLFAPRSVAIANGQMIVADERRMLFWNDVPASVVNGKIADGYVGPPNPFVHTGPSFGRIHADQSNRLWVLRDNKIEVYSIPLTTGAEPIRTITSPLPLRGGGLFTWTDSLSIGGITTIGSGDKVWIADPRNHRVFRINSATTDADGGHRLGAVRCIGSTMQSGARVRLTRSGQLVQSRRGCPRSVW